MGVFIKRNATGSLFLHLRYQKKTFTGLYTKWYFYISPSRAIHCAKGGGLRILTKNGSTARYIWHKDKSPCWIKNYSVLTNNDQYFFNAILVFRTFFRLGQNLQGVIFVRSLRSFFFPTYTVLCFVLVFSLSLNFNGFAVPFDPGG